MTAILGARYTKMIQYMYIACCTRVVKLGSFQKDLEAKFMVISRQLATLQIVVKVTSKSKQTKYM